MAMHREQIGRDRRLVNAPWKYIKRAHAKWRRREEKRDPENAPRGRCYRGWVA